MLYISSFIGAVITDLYCIITHCSIPYPRTPTLPSAYSLERTPPPRGGLLLTMFPHQEPCVRGPPSKHLVQILRGGSSYSRFLMREHSKWQVLSGRFLSIMLYHVIFNYVVLLVRNARDNNNNIMKHNMKH